jgi:hypothetical protein
MSLIESYFGKDMFHVNQLFLKLRNIFTSFNKEYQTFAVEKWLRASL